MMRETLVFGPIHSRRLGTSLGINLLPERGKICNFDCIYCECGWNRDGRGDTRLPSPEALEAALAAKLSGLSGGATAGSSEGGVIDSITFSGDGEPTLHPQFAAMVDVALSMRDRYCPTARVSVLSNATRLSDPDVFAALRRVDNPILKLDAPTDALAARINRPAPGYRVADVVAGMRRFAGDFVLQTMFLRAPGFDSSAPEVLGGWMEIVRQVRPRRVMVYTLDRPAPMAGLERFTPGQMRALVAPLLAEGFDIQING